MKLAVCAYLVACLAIYSGQMAWRATESHQMLAPCDDALAALLAEHWECTAFRYSAKTGWYLQCLGSNIAITDGIVDEKRHVYESFIYTHLGTMRQGVCDCGGSYGPACQYLD
jgi:hypothetical protein